MSAAKRPSAPTGVEAIRHQDSRVNIPTGELRDFVADQEALPRTVLYPRDPSLDPQLVWKGKDEQDAEDLAVPAVPVYIQEKIQPQVIIENLRRTAAEGQPEPEATLFDDFNGIEFEELVDFYAHEQHWTNRLILGDSLLVMNSLAEKERLKGKVQMIYMDPPYGIKFGSNWQVSTRKRDVRDGKAADVTRQPEMIKAYRDTWELGVHSYLSYLRDRLTVSRELLTESGSIFVQIGDENVHLVRAVMDEVFGSDNFCSAIVYQKAPYATSSMLPPVYDTLLWYAKARGAARYRQLFRERDRHEIEDKYRYTDDRGERFQSVSLISPGPASTSQPFTYGGRIYNPPTGSHWKTTMDGLERVAVAGRLFAARNSLRFKSRPSDFSVSIRHNIWTDTITGSFTEDKVYVVQTNTKVIERCLQMTTDPGDLVLDPTCGSGTTAYVAEQWGRRWITTDTSRVALALARTRIMAARFPYYLLTDSPEGRQKEAELTATAPDASPTTGDVRKGFVYKRVPHITLKSIAQNPEIQEGMSRDEIDAAIARHAETELLRDQPYEDKRKVRVSGPFTVESLSPHRVLDVTEEQPTTVIAAEQEPDAVQFEQMVLENLRKAGVQNTVKQERLVFSRLEPYAGHWLNAEGDYLDANGDVRRVAISIGPEHGTVGPEQVKEAAKEAIRGAGFDVLVVCGFAFDARSNEVAKEFTPAASEAAGEFAVSEETRQYGRLPVLLARMNPDLAMGDDLLKTTGAGNLFMVFGEPDLDVAASGGQLTVEIRGVDVYDPTTGEIRSNTTDDIACWFVDTDYNGESFFVRHAYFTGADEPYQRLQRALKADIDEAAWESLYSTVSRPFDPPTSGRIAVKVINHYGDEVLKVYEVSAAPKA